MRNGERASPEVPALPPTPQVRAARVAQVSGRNDDPMKQTRNETAVITPTARVTAARRAIRAARPRRLTSTLLWAAQILMAAVFVFIAGAGMGKLIGTHFEVQQFLLTCIRR